MRRCTILAVTLVITVGFLFLFVQQLPAQNTELRVYASDGVKTTIEELLPQIERSTGSRLAMTYETSRALRTKIDAGEPFDIAILSSELIADLTKQGKIAPGTQAEIARAGIGIGVRAGASKPDISTPEALKRTLLNVKSIGFNPVGASAVRNYEMFARLGIAEDVKPKLMLIAEGGGAQRSVAAGKTEIVITAISEIKFFPGIDYVGPLPSDFQSYINFAAGIAANTRNQDTAKAMIKFITGPAVAPTLEAKGLERH